MGLLSHRVKKEDIKPGDHIYTYRAGYTYSHHGIYVGGSEVIHFTPDPIHTSFVSSSSSSFNHTTRVSSSSSSFDYSTGVLSLCPNFPDCGFRQPNNGVILSCLDCFLGSGSPRLYQYGVSKIAFLVKVRGGSCTMAKSDPPETVIHRANHLLHFGFPDYDVMQNNCEDFALYCKTGLLDTSGLGSSGQTSSLVGPVVSIPARLLTSNPVGLAAVTVGTHCVTRFSNDIGVNTDAVEIPVEALGP